MLVLSEVFPYQSVIVSHCVQHCLPLYVCVCRHCLAGMVHLQEDGLEYNDKDKECLEERKIFTWE